MLVANSENYDVEELSHKLVHRLTQLQQENENLLKIISFGNKTNLLIEIGLLKHEIELLKKGKDGFVLWKGWHPGGRRT